MMGKGLALAKPDPRMPRKRGGDTASLVYDRLRAGILSGELQPGSPLSQLRIAKTAGISRGPVREALCRLQQDHLVVARTNWRFNVAPLDVADLEVVYSLHLINVTFAIEVSVPLLTSREIERARSCAHILEGQVQVDLTLWEAAYRDFILTLITHAGPRTVSLVEGLIDNIERYRHGLFSTARSAFPPSVFFSRIVDAAERGDGENAARFYAGNMGRMSTLALLDVAPNYDAATLRGYLSAMAAGQDREPTSDFRPN